METIVRTPHEVFYAPQRLDVPLFQRPYVWTREGQWAPLWADVRRLAELALNGPDTVPHFLGAVVLQSRPYVVGGIPNLTVIDGQQRLTTLQLLLDAVRSVALEAGAHQAADQLRTLVENDAPFRGVEHDRFKVWPTNRDRDAFVAAMTGTGHTGPAVGQQQVAAAHTWFRGVAEEWIGDEDAVRRATALTHVLRTKLQLVVIQLGVDEDAQEIFETLNARGTPLSAADLVKNFVFQRLDATPSQAQTMYEKFWRQFETPFWEKEVTVGTTPQPRSSVFLTQWLTARVAEEVPPRQVFTRFKHYAQVEAGEAMTDLLPRLHASAVVHREFIESGQRYDGDLDRLGLFVYRTGALNQESVRAVLLWALDPDQEPIPGDQLDELLGSVESWAVRRSLLRLSTAGYARLVAELLQVLRNSPRSEAGSVTTRVLAQQTSSGTYWPPDAEVRDQLRTSPVYRRLRRGRLRMVLEAVEDHARGYGIPGTRRFADSRVGRNKLAIEHVLPQTWETNWSIGDDPVAKQRRTEHVHVLGNLTLVTGSLNSKVSNGPWLGTGGKREALHAHDVLMLNRRVREVGEDGWDETVIDARTDELTGRLLQVWPAPAGHAVRPDLGSTDLAHISVRDLLQAGLLQPDQPIYARRAEREHEARVRADGWIVVDGVAFETLSGAGKVVTGHALNGWWFWSTDRAGVTTLRKLREQLAAGDGIDDAAE